PLPCPSLTLRVSVPAFSGLPPHPNPSPLRGRGDQLSRLTLHGIRHHAPRTYLLNPSISLIKGKNNAITIDPIMPPKNTIIKGSSKLIRLSTKTSTSSS